MISEYASEENRLLSCGGILPVKDGYILGSLLGTETELTPWVSEVYWQPMIIKLDTAFNILWETPFISNIPTANIRVEDIILSSSKDGYVGVGISVDTTTTAQKHIGLMFKLGLDGDSIWMRLHSIINTTPTAYQHLKQIQKTQDGGYIMAGEAFSFSGPESTQSGWLIKVDSHGCIVPGCHLVATEDLESRSIDVRLWPNPVHDVLHIFTRHADELHVTLSDMEGQVVRSFETVRGEGTWSVVVDDLLSGVYLVNARDRAGGYWSQKFIKL